MSANPPAEVVNKKSNESLLRVEAGQTKSLQAGVEPGVVIWAARSVNIQCHARPLGTDGAVCTAIKVYIQLIGCVIEWIPQDGHVQFHRIIEGNGVKQKYKDDDIMGYKGSK